jgi:pilus assembly protein CpaE
VAVQPRAELVAVAVVVALAAVPAAAPPAPAWATEVQPMSASAQLAVTSPADDKPAISAMAFVTDSTAQARVSAELFNMTLGKANVREGSLDHALALPEWPRELDLLVVDVAGSADPVADAAALKTAVPGGCIVIGLGRINDVALYRDLLALGFHDYLTVPLAEGMLGRAVERAFEQRERGGLGSSAGPANKDAKPRTLAVIGSRGGVGATTVAITMASMLGARLKEEVLLIDFDLHYGSLMLALDLDAIDALREALDQPDRIDALFIQQVAQKKSEFLYAIGAEEPPTGGFQARPHAAKDFLRQVHRRFRWIVADVPRGDPVIQRQVIEGATDILLITDLSLPGVRDAMRLQQLAHDVSPTAKLHLATSGVIDARRSPVKVGDVERTLKRKVDCQIPADAAAALSAVNFGKPLVEAAPASGIVKALRPLVTALDSPVAENGRVGGKGASSVIARFAQGLKSRKK